MVSKKQMVSSQDVFLFVSLFLDFIGFYNTNPLGRFPLIFMNSFKWTHRAVIHLHKWAHIFISVQFSGTGNRDADLMCSH